jgi:NDP-sugar pyrophosphorylase family protein
MDSLLDISKTIATEIFTGKEHPRDVLPDIKEFIMKLGASLPVDKFDNPVPGVWIARSAKVADNASISGPCIIDENCEVRHCAYIRGSAIIGKGAVVGNSTEIKNSILFDGVQVPHFNYVGDSVLGYKAHFGAGVITANVRSDKANVCEGFRKLGAIVGDYAEIGCNSVLCPGAIVGKNSIVYPLSRVRGSVPENSIFKAQDDIVRR